MIIKENDYNVNTIIDYLTEEESNDLRNITSIPVLESNEKYIISYDNIRSISEDYDIEDIEAVAMINESNNIEDSIVSISESDIILDPTIVDKISNYVIEPLSYNNDENLLMEGFFNAFEESGDYDFLDILEENFEDIIINEDKKRKLRKFKGKVKEIYTFSDADLSGSTKDNQTQEKGTTVPKVEKVDNNTVSVEQPQSNTQPSQPTNNTNTSTPKPKPAPANTTTTNKPETSGEEEKSFYSKHKKTIGGVGAGLALGGLALANRKRIANGISALRNKLNKYKMQRKYDKSGAVGKAIIRIQQMIDRLTARLHASK